MEGARKFFQSLKSRRNWIFWIEINYWLIEQHSSEVELMNFIAMRANDFVLFLCFQDGNWFFSIDWSTDGQGRTKFPRISLSVSTELWLIPLQSILLSGKKTGHMMNRKSGRPGQEICHKVNDANGKFECPKKSLIIFAMSMNSKPNIFIKKSGKVRICDRNRFEIRFLGEITNPIIDKSSIQGQWSTDLDSRPAFKRTEPVDSQSSW